MSDQVPIEQVCKDLGDAFASFIATKFPGSGLGFALVLYKDNSTAFASPQPNEALSRMSHLVVKGLGPLDKPPEPDTIPASKD